VRIPSGALAACGLAPSSLAIVLAFAAPAAARAEVVQCAADIAGVCSSRFDIQVEDFDGNPNNNMSGFGQLIWNEETGEIGLDTTGDFGPTNGKPAGSGLMWDLGGGATASVGSLTGNADPILMFGVGSATGASGAAFSFTFNLPISMSGLIRANSTLGYTLTASPNSFAQILPFGAGSVLEALHVDTDGGAGFIDKNVDLGPAFSFTDATGIGSTQVQGYSSALSFFNVSTAYDLMTVRLSYILSPNTSVGLSGLVQQVVVPLPAALPLLLAGLAGFGALRRRRSAI